MFVRQIRREAPQGRHEILRARLQRCHGALDVTLVGGEHEAGGQSHVIAPTGIRAFVELYDRLDVGADDRLGRDGSLRAGLFQ